MPRKKKERLKVRKDGRYKCKYHGIQFYGETPEAAFAARDEYIRNQEKGFQRQTVTEYALPWLKRTFPDVADSTYTGLAIHLQHLIDEIGDKQIDSVVPSDIKQVYSVQYKGRSNSYLKAAKQLFSSLFDSAVADGLCRSNPARDKTAKPQKGNKPKERKLSKQQREWIETLCTDHRAWPAVMTMLYAGVRPQEMKAIDIDRDVDFQNDILTVRETAHIDPDNAQKYAYTEEGKTDWSNRQIPLFPPLKQALKGKHGYLITSAHGERVTIQTWKTAWESYCFCMETAINGIQKRWYGRTKEHKKILEAGGKLPEWIDFDIVPYTLRHAFCVMCRDSGVEMNTCRRWMGHADAKMILKVYDSVSEDRSEQEREKVEKRLIGVQNGVQKENGKPETLER
jgi:integrase